jgi:hypothetical protein
MQLTSSKCFAATSCALLLATIAVAQSVPVEKTNSTPLYMHYMPWFQTPVSQGGTGGSQWGFHWKMNTQNPNIVDASGKRQIASHYYPKIGPYDSTDPNVIEYHLLLMKYSGIDGPMIDWYGVQGANGDVDSLLTASNAIINKVGNYGLQFGVVAEDNFWTNSISDPTPDINKAKTNMNYLRDNYFNNPSYIRATAGTNTGPLLFNFGPIRFTQPSQWTQILAETGTNPVFVPLNYHANFAGTNADGEFAWPYQDAGTTDHILKLRSFYTSQATQFNIAAGVAYPGFNDFYQQGGAGSTLFYIPENNGQTLTDTLNLYDLYKPNLEMLQLATFNDFGEGTMFEPTVEDGFRSLHQIQLYTGAKDPNTQRTLDETDLQLIYQLYLARKEYAGNAAIQSLLNAVSADLNSLQIDSARTLLNQAAPPADYNGDGLVNASDYNAWRNSFGSSTIIYGTGADGSYDGSVNAADYVTWRKSLGAGSGSSTTPISAPEPAAAALLLVTFAFLSCFGRCRP